MSVTCVSWMAYTGIQLLSLCLYMTLKKPAISVITVLRILGVDMLIQTTACHWWVLHIFEGTENEKFEVVCYSLMRQTFRYISVHY